MKPLFIMGAMIAVVCAVFFLLRPREHVVPENFPQLDSTATESIKTPEKQAESVPGEASEVATFGSGCFWCTEAFFLQMRGVQKVVSGYCGGTVENPTYQQVCSGTTGHAEVIQVTFDPKKVTYSKLLELFWRSHDPTTKDRQGNDVGTQYRSVVFYHNDTQRELAETYKKKIDAAGVYKAPIVTEIVPIQKFYPAEDYHQNYYALNPRQGYCQAVIGPKLEKLKKVFAEDFDPKK